MNKAFFLLLMVICSWCSQALSQPKENRVALVVGNGAYKSAPLRNPTNDAKDMAAKLKGMGFTVIERNNLTVKQIGSTLREFRSKLTPGSVALFFYAGHGLQIKGENYLPAVDADISSEEDVPTQSLAMHQIMDVLGDAKTRLNLVFLDACRNNPYARNFRSVSDGLNRVNAPSGTLISFATRPGSIASDGTGRNGLYTGSLLEQMNNQGQPIEQVLKKVVSQVKAGSNSQQEPWMEGSIEGEFCFGECGNQVVQNGVSDDRALWETVKDSRDISEIKAYLNRFPFGLFVGVATAKKASLEKAEAQIATNMLPADTLSLSTPKPPALYVGNLIKDCSDCPELIEIPAGSFDMGSNDEADSRPVRRVNLQGFLIGKTEVTQGQWKSLMGNAPSEFNQCGDSCPVEYISWDDAQEFAKKLSQKTGKKYRIPTEAEWEYSARAGASTKWSSGENSNQLSDYAWYSSNSIAMTHPVAEKMPNGFGLFDMEGNVWEWTQDCWIGNFLRAPTDGSAWTSGDCSRRVVRGGSWKDGPRLLRSALRSWYISTGRYNNNGFRIVRTP